MTEKSGKGRTLLCHGLFLNVRHLIMALADLAKPCISSISSLIYWSNRERRCSTVKKQKLNYRFHNPNTVEDTTDTLLKIFIEANQQKAEAAIRQAVEQIPQLTPADT